MQSSALVTRAEPQSGVCHPGSVCLAHAYSGSSCWASGAGATEHNPTLASRIMRVQTAAINGQKERSLANQRGGKSMALDKALFYVTLTRRIRFTPGQRARFIYSICLSFPTLVLA